MQDSPNLLILYGHHHGVTASHIASALGSMASVMCAGPGMAEDETHMPCDVSESVLTILRALRGRFSPDAVLVIESGEKFFPMDLEKLEIPCFYYSIDAHFNLTWQSEYAKLFDALFVTFRQYAATFRNTGHPAVYWLPHGYNDAHYHDFNAPERDIDIAFVGDMDPNRRPERMAMLQALQDAGLKTVFTRGIWNEEVGKVYSRAKLAFNDNDHKVLNPRNFEAAACGAVVLSNDAESLSEFFVDGQNILLHQNAPQMLDHAQTLLADPDRWRQLSEAGKANAGLHTWKHRSIVLLDLIAPFLRQKRRHFPHQEIIKASAFVYQNRGLPGRAVQMLNELQKQYPHDVELTLQKALVYLSNNFHQQAAEVLMELFELNPPPPGPFFQQIASALINAFHLANHAEGAVRAAMAIPNLSAEQRAILAQTAARHTGEIPDAARAKLCLPPAAKQQAR
ncbi:glycosyltransferase [Magnetofaba australis]|uniref:Spore protein YkvP/CgeB glycosyl transferase-like domain-containing protein n=1 Tax=Magnetofaba australis IT-1 TaxID=1434232 RepID=A0A1Y2K2L5_9PROT|nr:glycosyltransferase [Magnetofaba australis]OSM02281.1 hypothetical protein MAIT1_02401 [Magnetofaba australis IT-1]